MRRGAAVVIAGLGIAGTAFGSELDQAASIRALTPSEAAEARPASVRGVVTFAHQAHFGAYGFVQDGSAGIYFPIREGTARLRAGDAVQIHGVTRPGDFAPYIEATSVEGLGRADLPTPNEVTITEMFDGHLDSQWVRVRAQGRLTGRDEPGDVTTLETVSEHRRLRIDFPGDVDEERLADLWGADIEVTGVCATMFNEQRQLIGVRMLVASLDQVRVLRRPVGPYELPCDPIGELLRFRPGRTNALGLAHIQGFVTQREASGAFTLQDASGGVLAYARRAPDLGTQVEVVGFLESTGLTPVLHDSRYRVIKTEEGGALKPIIIQNILDAEYANRLVTIEVVLLDRFNSERELVLSTRHANGIIRVTLPSEAPQAILPDLQLGARLRLTGVLHLLRNPADMQRSPNSFAISPSTGQLRLRHVRDVLVLESAPYWTAARTQFAVAGLGACLILGLLWLTALRRRVALQTEVIRDQLEREQGLKKQAEAANEAKSLFLAMISHELRTPMNGVVGVAELLNADAVLNAKQRELVGIIEQSSVQLLQLLDDLLDFSRLEAGALPLDPVPTALRPAIDRAVSMVRPRAEQKGLTLTARVDSDCPSWVTIDGLRVVQVVLNLLTNAIKFTAHGSVALEVSARSNDKIHVRVTDTGIGLSADAQARMFRRFSQADASISRRYGGTGLGLAICKGLVEAMDGQIGVESTAGKGSCFWFTCRAPTAMPEAARPIEGERSAPCAACRVLLVDDHPVNLKVGDRMLRLLGLAPDVADSGEQAMERLRLGHYDLVLMDVHMPGMDGLSCTRAIRSSLPADRQPYILALTADAAMGDRVACIEAGMNDHLAKPLTLNALAQALAKAGIVVDA